MEEIKWIDDGHSCGPSGVTSFYHGHGKDGKYYTKSINPQGVTCIECAPSESYYNNYLLGGNKGTRITTEWPSLRTIQEKP